MATVTRTRACPNCKSEASITWQQVMAYGADYPVREDVSGFTCSTGCRLPFADVQRVYPTADSGAQPQS